MKLVFVAIDGYASGFHIAAKNSGDTNSVTCTDSLIYTTGFYELTNCGNYTNFEIVN